MKSTFWNKLAKPIMTLAPMANVTDAAFRQMFAQYGKPDVLWTEFVSVEGLLSAGKDHLMIDFWFQKNEYPIVAQIFGSEPAHFEKVAGLIYDLGFDGIDINMGCPDKNVQKQGAGAALINDPDRAAEIIRATKRGAKGLPVSVKTRIGYNTDQIDEWLPALFKEDIAALTVHLRTRKEMSDVPAHWELAPRIVELRDKIAPTTILLGNGDVDSLADAQTKIKESGMDGVMVGRGAFGNPWFFSGTAPSLTERLHVLMEHADLFEKLYITEPTGKGMRQYKNFEIMKKHFKAYLVGFDGAKELRMQLMETESATEVRRLIEAFLAKIG